MPELTHAGLRCQLEWDRDTEHWFGQIDGTEVRVIHVDYGEAEKQFRESADVLADPARRAA